MMRVVFGLTTVVLLLTANWAQGADEVVELGGMSIIGNRELPKSLYIVPWKDTEVEVETELSRDLLDEGMNPVDPEVFGRQLDYYELTHK